LRQGRREAVVVTTGSLILRAIFMVALPTAVFFGGVAIMKKVTHHQEAEKRACSASNPSDRKPLDQRFGYDAGAVDRYWGAIDGALPAEQHFLEVDLVFPFLYGGALAASLLLAWSTLSRPFSPAWLIAPVAITVLADWTENLVQLAQLRRYSAGGAHALQAGWIRVASAATSLKLSFFGASSLLLLILVAMVLLCAARNPAPGQP
jgi:hypothetical protein